jgi:hypothetical protein
MTTACFEYAGLFHLNDTSSEGLQLHQSLGPNYTLQSTATATRHKLGSGCNNTRFMGKLFVNIS